jgi:polyphenol oxidase
LQSGAIGCWSIARGLYGTPFDARDNRDVERACQALGLVGTLRQAVQEHGILIDENGTSEACDAFLLKPGEAALVRHADCFPVVVADPVRSRSILAHCGWRGTAAGLAGDCARRLLGEGSNPGDLVAAIGAGIGATSFEVGPEVLKTFPDRFHGRTSWGTSSVDLVGFLRHDLELAGVQDIQVHSPDTFTDPQWHSFRRDGEHSGRNATICIVVPASSQPGEPP